MSPARPLLLVGSGGFARETAEAVRALGGTGGHSAARPFELLGFLDDDPVTHGIRHGGVAVLGPVDAVADHPDAAVAVCTGRPGNYISRKRLVRRLALPAERYARIVHPSAVLPADAPVGAGTIVLAGVVVTAAATLGAHVAVMPGVIFTHDDEVGDFTTFGAGVRLGGGVRVGEGAYLGSGVLVRENLSVGAWSLLGMGALVTRDVPAAELWYGSPARRVRALDIPSDVRDGNGAGTRPAAVGSP